VLSTLFTPPPPLPTPAASEPLPLAFLSRGLLPLAF
jgi:hypothetical protein